MSEHIFIEKRQRERAREKPLVTTRRIVMLLVLSLSVFAGFRIWIGNPNAALCGDDCGSMHSLFAWVLGFFMIFAAIIAAGAAVGVLVALLRRKRRTPFTSQVEDRED